MVVAAPLPDARHGAELGFDHLYEEHLSFVWRVLAATGAPESRLEDAAQDVFVIVHRKLAEFGGRSKLTTWLYGIARHVALEERRKAARATTAGRGAIGAANPSPAVSASPMTPSSPPTLGSTPAPSPTRSSTPQPRDRARPLRLGRTGRQPRRVDLPAAPASS
jgi:RNA polymerase sigma factor (sigma-70 family)